MTFVFDSASKRHSSIPPKRDFLLGLYGALASHATMHIVREKERMKQSLDMIHETQLKRNAHLHDLRLAAGAGTDEDPFSAALTAASSLTNGAPSALADEIERLQLQVERLKADDESERLRLHVERLKGNQGADSSDEDDEHESHTEEVEEEARPNVAGVDSEQDVAVPTAAPLREDVPVAEIFCAYGVSIAQPVVMEALVAHQHRAWDKIEKDPVGAFGCADRECAPMARLLPLSPYGRLLADDHSSATSPTPTIWNPHPNPINIDSDDGTVFGFMAPPRIMPVPARGSASMWTRFW